MKRLFLAGTLPFVLLGACATTSTAEQRASYEKMESGMGTDDRHDHSEQKGMGRSSMNLTHGKCRQILAKSR
ncbi:hypothetical protein LPN01_04430 [Sphingomonas sp. A2-49]|uniref:hypothetical protein n=1 Tax=Sphingomonas sp. A2-49 TaxID=1391375 RepID=UPI0021CFE558|nr:hypothetical protein [Sphingomonas sp. A2-49]MCU6453318.1 hypothetical protein [Sphingomonas sp. A2-49]